MSRAGRPLADLAAPPEVASEFRRACPVCGGAPRETFPTPFATVAKCANRACGHLWAVDAAPGAGIHPFEDPDSYAGLYDARNRDLGRFLRGRGYLKPGARLLDVGAGTGHLLQFLAEAIPGMDIVAVEADPASLSRLRTLGFTAHATLEAVAGAFDAINLIEVIEHIDEPMAFLSLLHAKLAPGGRLFCTTPCGETRTGSRRTSAYDAREHVQFFTETSLALCFQRAGFYRFSCETINAMTSKLTPAPARYIKDVVRPIRAALVGRQHLTGFALA